MAANRDDLVMNDDYPQNPVTVSVPQILPEPLLDLCERMRSNVPDEGGEFRSALVCTGPPATYSSAGRFEMNDITTSTPNDSSIRHTQDRQRQRSGIAYLICDELRDAIFGTVYHGIVLRSSPAGGWHKTSEECAIKKMEWTRIRQRNGTNCQENPKQEMAVMQYLKQYFVGINVPAAAAMLQTGIIMPLEFFYDRESLYIITPFCSDGELWELLNDESRLNTKFTEEESRYLLTNILNGLEHLQRAGLCHLDISLENIMIHQERTALIDMGMSLKIPFVHNEENDTNVPRNIDYRDERAHRCLIDSETPYGKPYCKAPENNNGDPFDGHAVDMWPVGVCLFTMLTGRKPWEMARETDWHFRHYSGGYLVALLTNDTDINLSGDAMDILQRMLWADPKDRLSLQQVRNHPWMNGPTNNPTNN